MSKNSHFYHWAAFNQVNGPKVYLFCHTVSVVTRVDFELRDAF
jgi:hypothetical protein